MGQQRDTNVNGEEWKICIGTAQGHHHGMCNARIPKKISDTHRALESAGQFGAKMTCRSIYGAQMVGTSPLLPSFLLPIKLATVSDKNNTK